MGAIKFVKGCLSVDALRGELDSLSREGFGDLPVLLVRGGDRFALVRDNVYVAEEREDEEGFGLVVCIETPA